MRNCNFFLFFLLSFFENPENQNFLAPFVSALHAGFSKETQFLGKKSLVDRRTYKDENKIK